MIGNELVFYFLEAQTKYDLGLAFIILSLSHKTNILYKAWDSSNQSFFILESHHSGDFSCPTFDSKKLVS